MRWILRTQHLLFLQGGLSRRSISWLKEFENDWKKQGCRISIILILQVIKINFPIDPLGNMQRWFVTLSELHLALCQITGDASWLEKEERGVEDNINSIVARIMEKLHECVEGGYLGGEKVKELQA